MKDVFISYKSEEFYEANWVKTTLETNGISCWMAPMCIPGGSSYAVEIPQAIRDCKVFVLILSRRSQNSTWVPKELDQAINSGKTVLPFMLEDCPLKDDFNFYLTNVQRYAAYESKSKAIQRMINEIKAIIGKDGVAPYADDNGGKAAPETGVKDKKTESPKKNSRIDLKSILLIIGCTLGVAALACVLFIVMLGGNDGDEGEASSHYVLDAESVSVTESEVESESQTESESKTESDANSESAPESSVTNGVIIIAGTEISAEEDSVSLKELTLTEDDIKNFACLPNLKYVYLTDCVIEGEDISSLCGESVRVLSMENCGITDSMLGSINFESSVLYSLTLNGNPNITDLSPIAPLADTLYNLYFSNCAVTDLSFLKDFDCLGALEADGNGIKDITALGTCDDLYRIYMSYNEISSLSPLKSLTGLEKLYVYSNKLTSLEGLETCLELTDISAGGNQLKDINGIANATVLEVAYFTDAGLSDVSLLEKSAKTLKYVHLGGNKLSDLSFMSVCTEIRHFYADNTGLTSLEFMKDWSKLEQLSVADNKINSINGIEGSSTLTFLDISGNRISTLKSLTFDPDCYAHLDVSDNKLTKLELAAGKYRNLYLYGNQISDLSVLADTEGFNLAFEYNADIDFEALDDCGYSTHYVFGCPLDKQLSVKDALGSYSTVFTTIEEFTGNGAQ